MIAKYGRGAVIRASLLSVSLVFIAVLSGTAFLGEILAAAGVALFLFVLYFFRDPERVTQKKKGVVVSPADGRVLTIRNLFESEFLSSDAVEIGIFMSPLDVHVNRIPVSGEVRFLRYVPGKYLIAFREKSSEENERMLIGIGGSGFRILVRQIAGFIARRIVCDLKVGDEVKAGERFGMIKFGSRVEVVIPRGAVLKVKRGDRVRAGETILAKIGGGA